MGRKSIPTRLPRVPKYGIIPGITKMARMKRMTITTRRPMLTTLYISWGDSSDTTDNRDHNTTRQDRLTCITSTTWRTTLNTLARAVGLVNYPRRLQLRVGQDIQRFLPESL